MEIFGLRNAGIGSNQFYRKTGVTYDYINNYEKGYLGCYSKANPISINVPANTEYSLDMRGGVDTDSGLIFNADGTSFRCTYEGLYTIEIALNYGVFSNFLDPGSIRHLKFIDERFNLEIIESEVFPDNMNYANSNTRPIIYMSYSFVVDKRSIKSYDNFSIKFDNRQSSKTCTILGKNDSSNNFTFFKICRS